jgi:DNA repair protein RadD
MGKDYGFQAADREAIWSAWDDVRSVLYVLPTGGGKTVVAAMVARDELDAGGRVLILANRREQVRQARAQLRKVGVLDIDIDTIMANGDEFDPDASIFIASVHTLDSWRRRGIEFPPATVAIADEAHHACSPQWMRVLGCYPRAHILGLTATPYRLDGKGLGVVFQVVVGDHQHRELFNRGVLSEPRDIYSIDREMIEEELKAIKRGKSGDYARAELSRLAQKKPLVKSYVRHYGDHGRGQRAVVYAVDIDHATIICEHFRRAGYDAEMLSSKTSPPERRRILADFKSGKIRILVNCEILTEGWDMPSAMVCIIARPTLSVALHDQMIGRFLRPYGRQRPVILDHAGNIHRHGLPWVAPGREWSLDAGLKKRRKGRPVMKDCTNCKRAIPAGCLTCPECGYEFPEPKPLEVEGALIRWTPDAREGRLRAIREIAIRRGAPTEWADRVAGMVMV